MHVVPWGLTLRAGRTLAVGTCSLWGGTKTCFGEFKLGSTTAQRLSPKYFYYSWVLMLVIWPTIVKVNILE